LATEEVVGTVRARQRASIEAKISGRIDSVLVAPGHPVKTGDLLVRLDAREIKARLDQAVAAREQAEGDLKRFVALFKSQTISQAEFDAIQSRARIARAAAAEAETTLGQANVLAPFDGVVTRKFAEVGDLAAPGRALLEVEDPSALRFEADVPETAAGRMAPGVRLPVRVAGLDRDLEGVVGEISPAIDPASRTFLVKLDLPPVEGLRIGQFGRVAVPVGETTTLRLPAPAVLRRGQMELVFVVVDGRAWLRLVKSGKRFGDDVELVSGLEAGEVVVVDGAAALQDRQPIEVR
jgi:RND family efflux transporter MFP subunit